MKEDNKKKENEQCTIHVVSGSCFWGHKWTKWEQYTQQMIARSNGQHHINYRQRRTCIRCRKMQDEMV